MGGYSMNWEQQFVESFITKLVNPPVNNDDLMDKVINQIKSDLSDGDVTAIEELLNCVPVKNLQAFLGEL